MDIKAMKAKIVSIEVSALLAEDWGRDRGRLTEVEIENAILRWHSDDDWEDLDVVFSFEDGILVATPGTPADSGDWDPKEKTWKTAE